MTVWDGGEKAVEWSGSGGASSVPRPPMPPPPSPLELTVSDTVIMIFFVRRVRRVGLVARNLTRRMTRRVRVSLSVRTGNSRTTHKLSSIIGHVKPKLASSWACAIINHHRPNFGVMHREDEYTVFLQSIATKTPSEQRIHPGLACDWRLANEVSPGHLRSSGSN